MTPTFAVLLSSSLLLQLFLVLDYATVSEAASISSRRSLDFSSVQACYCCQSSSKYQYSVVIDAGSSGTRVHVYRWPQSTAGRVESTPGAVQALRPTLKIRVGLETLARNLTIVRHHVERLLINASRIVPPELHQYTPVYFLATAGMREMLEPRMDDLMTYINNLMLNTGINPFRYDAETGSRVLSGEEEAVFDWISINYLLGNFADKADKPLVGVVEMGGASVQIAFMPGGDVTRDLFSVHMVDRRYLVYAHSYLGYGQTTVVDYIKTRLEADNRASEVIHHPCMLRGDVQTTASGKTLVGTGDPQSCVNLLRELVVYKVKDVSRCQPLQHAIGAVCQPSLPDQLQFYAVGAFIYTLPSLSALTDDAVFVPAVGYRKAFEFCKLSYDEALMTVSEAERKYITDKCLAALYIPLLLNHGLGFSNDSSVIHVLGNISGQKPGWTLGAVLYENCRIQYDCEQAAAAVVAAADSDADVDDIRVMLSRLLVVGSD